MQRFHHQVFLKFTTWFYYFCDSSFANAKQLMGYWYPIQRFSPFEKLKVHGALMMVTFGFATYQIVTPIGFSRGINQYIYPFYRNVIGLGFVGSLAFFSERKVRTPLSMMLLLKFFLLAFCGVFLNQSLYLVGLQLTSATFASALQNITPTLVFMMAAFLGMEEVNIWRIHGQAKVAGALSGVGGAMLMSLYRGPCVIHPLQSIPVNANPPSFLQQALLTFTNPPSIENSTWTTLGHVNIFGLRIPKWQVGAVALILNCASCAAWIVLQVPVLKKYPARFSLVAFVNFFATIQLGLFAWWHEPHLSSWKITDACNILVILYAGVITSGVAFTLQTWCVQQAGPVITAAYQPLQTVMVGFLALSILGDDMRLGSVIGAVLIVAGLYLVAWGESKRQCDLVLKDCMRLHIRIAGVATEGGRSDNETGREPLLSSS